jgi:hypothetical protein
MAVEDNTRWMPESIPMTQGEVHTQGYLDTQPAAPKVDAPQDYTGDKSQTCSVLVPNSQRFSSGTSLASLFLRHRDDIAVLTPGRMTYKVASRLSAFGPTAPNRNPYSLSNDSDER